MMVVLKSLLFLIVIPGTVLVLLPNWLLSSVRDPFPLPIGLFSYLGLAPMILGAVVIVWCVWDFTFTGKGTPAPIDPPKELVVKGLYRYVRNPMYIGVLLVLLGESLLFQSGAILVFGIVLFLLFHSFVLFYEERALKKKFGQAYEDLLNTVPRWIPRFRR